MPDQELGSLLPHVNPSALCPYSVRRLPSHQPGDRNPPWQGAEHMTRWIGGASIGALLAQSAQETPAPLPRGARPANSGGAALWPLRWASCLRSSGWA